MEGKKLRVLIVGAGIAGLATSIALRIKGHEVTVLEAASQVSLHCMTVCSSASAYQAAALRCRGRHSNSVRLLKYLGVYEQVYFDVVHVPELSLSSLFLDCKSCNMAALYYFETMAGRK